MVRENCAVGGDSGEYSAMGNVATCLMLSEDDCDVGLSLGGVVSRDSVFGEFIAVDEKKEGVESRFDIKFEGRDNEGRAFDSLLRASAPAEEDRRCLAVVSMLDIADL